MLFLSKAIWLLLILCSTQIYADLIHHLKPAPNKGNNHFFGPIDFIYMINLDTRPEKFVQASQELQQYGIHPYRFSAVNGWELSLEAINDVGLVYQKGMTQLFATSFPLEGKGVLNNGFMTEEGQTYFGHGAAKGTIGISLSHISILQDAYDAGYEMIWVLEDDVVALQDPSILPSLLHKLDALVGKNGWDILFTDVAPRAPNGNWIFSFGAGKRPDMDCSKEFRFSDRFTKTHILSEDFLKISSRFGAYSMIIQRSGIKKLLDFFLEHKIYLPYDLEYYLPKAIQLYSLRYDLVTNLLDALSDNGSPHYLFSLDK